MFSLFKKRVFKKATLSPSVAKKPTMAELEDLFRPEEPAEMRRSCPVVKKEG